MKKSNSLALCVALTTVASATVTYADWHEATAKPNLVAHNSANVLAEKLGSINLIIASNDVNNSSSEIKADVSSDLDITQKSTSNSTGSKSETGNSEQTKSIIVTGYGIDHDQALKNALQSAVEQQVGVLIDSETMIKNDELIKNEILTASNGFVQKFDNISISTNNGLIEVKIKAEVKTQEVAKKIKSLNVSTLQVQENISDVYAEVVTKEKSKEDRKKMLENILEKVPSEKSYKELLNVELEGYEILKDETKDGKTPIEISYTINFNYSVYEEIIKEIEKTLKGIGATLKEKTDYPKIRYGYLYSSHDILKIIGNSISIIKKNGKIYIKDTWEIPKEIEKIHVNPLKVSNKTIISIELLNDQGGILEADTRTIDISRYYSNYGFRYTTSDYISSPYSLFHSHGVLLSPFFQIESRFSKSDTEMKTKDTIKARIMLNTEDLKSLKKIVIQYQ